MKDTKDWEEEVAHLLGELVDLGKRNDIQGMVFKINDIFEKLDSLLKEAREEQEIETIDRCVKRLTDWFLNETKDVEDVIGEIKGWNSYSQKAKKDLSKLISKLADTTASKSKLKKSDK